MKVFLSLQKVSLVIVRMYKFILTISKKIYHKSGLLIKRLLLLCLLVTLVLMNVDYTQENNGLKHNIGIIISFICVFCITWYLIFLSRTYIWKAYEVYTKQQAPRIFIILLNGFICFTMVSFVIVFILNKQFGVIFAGLSFFGASIAFALKSPILDTFSGGIINIERLIKIGDWVYIDQHEGKVIAMNWRSTILETINERHIFLPNSKISTKTLINYSRPRHSYMDSLYISIDYNVLPERVQRILVTAALSVPAVREHGSAFAYACDTTVGGIKYCLRFSVASFKVRLQTKHDVIQKVLIDFYSYGIKVSESLGEYAFSPARQLPSLLEPRSLKNALENVDFFKKLNNPQLQAEGL